MSAEPVGWPFVSLKNYFSGAAPCRSSPASEDPIKISEVKNEHQSIVYPIGIYSVAYMGA
jgi:hypothetical protein